MLLLQTWTGHDVLNTAFWSISLEVMFYAGIRLAAQFCWGPLAMLVGCLIALLLSALSFAILERPHTAREFLGSWSPIRES